MILNWSQLSAGFSSSFATFVILHVTRRWLIPMDDYILLKQLDQTSFWYLKYVLPWSDLSVFTHQTISRFRGRAWLSCLHRYMFHAGWCSSLGRQKKSSAHTPTRIDAWRHVKGSWMLQNKDYWGLPFCCNTLPVLRVPHRIVVYITDRNAFHKPYATMHRQRLVYVVQR